MMSFKWGGYDEWWEYFCCFLLHKNNRTQIHFCYKQWSFARFSVFPLFNVNFLIRKSLDSTDHISVSIGFTVIWKNNLFLLMLRPLNISISLVYITTRKFVINFLYLCQLSFVCIYVNMSFLFWTNIVVYF